MNPVSLGLDGFLALLLMAALMVGARLNTKLKSLKQSQAAFVKAVADLDLAAGRAEAGLSALRTATQEAHDTLLTRIETARSLSAKLDRAAEDARTATARLEVANHRAEAAAAAPPPPVLRLVEPSAAAASLDEAAVLTLIQSAREEADGRAAVFGALHGAPAGHSAAAAAAAAAAAPASAPASAPADRLARFVARRREGRSA